MKNQLALLAFLMFMTNISYGQVCETVGIVIGDSGGVGGGTFTSTSPQPTLGSKTDLTPELDIDSALERNDGIELSANADTYIPKEVLAGQVVYPNVGAKAHNADARRWKVQDGKSHNSIEVPFYYRIDNGNWNLIDSVEIQTDRLCKDCTSDKKFPFTIPPNLQPGQTISFQIQDLDSDEEITEENESNNDSRVEVLRIGEIASSPIDPPPTTNTGKSWNEMTPGERAAIMSVITNYLLSD